MARLVPAVWIIATLGATVALWTKSFSPREVAGSWLRSMAFWPFGPWIDSVYWTLGIEICFYGLVWVLLACGRSAWTYRVMLAVGTASTAFWAVWAMTPTGMLTAAADTRWLDLVLVHHGCLFAIGVWAHRRFVLGEHAAVAWPAVFTAGAVLQISHEALSIAEKTTTEVMTVPAVIAWAIAMLIFWATVSGRLRFRSVPERVSRAAGLATYPLYLVHNVIGGALIGGLVISGVSVSISLALVILVCVAGSIAIATLFEPPLQRWIRAALS